MEFLSSDLNFPTGSQIDPLFQNRAVPLPRPLVLPAPAKKLLESLHKELTERDPPFDGENLGFLKQRFGKRECHVLLFHTHLPLRQALIA